MWEPGSWSSRGRSRVHDCRHGAAANRLKAGVPLGETARRLDQRVATLVSTYVGALAGDEALSNARIGQVLAGAPPLEPSQAAPGQSEPVDGPTGPVAVIVRLRDEDADALGEGSLLVHMGAGRPEDMTRTPCGTTRRKGLRGNRFGCLTVSRFAVPPLSVSSSLPPSGSGYLRSSSTEPIVLVTSTVCSLRIPWNGSRRLTRWSSRLGDPQLGLPLVHHSRGLNFGPPSPRFREKARRDIRQVGIRKTFQKHAEWSVPCRSVVILPYRSA